MESTTGCQDNILTGTAGHRCPEPFLNRFATAGGPQDLFHPGTTGLGLQIGEEATICLHFHAGCRIVGSQSHSRMKTGIPFQIIEPHELPNPLPPTPGMMTQIGNQNAGGKVGQLSPFRSVVIGSLALCQHRHTGGACAQTFRFCGNQSFTKIV